MSSDSPIAIIPPWDVVSLKSVTLKIGSGSTPRGGASSYLKERSEYALVRSQNIFDSHFSKEGLAFISDSQASEMEGVHLQSGDVLLNITGDGVTFARAAIVPDEILPACVNQHVSIIRPNTEVLCNGYLLGYLVHPTVKSYIESFNSGGSRRAITKGAIESFRIPLPPLGEQKAIAHILGTLDDKIELNRKTNETLEAMAKALFKSWFVDFDPVRAKAEGRPTGLPDEISDLFPDSFEDSELGEIPSGWQCCSFTKLIDVISGGTPKTSIDEYWNGSIPWFSVVDAPPGSGCWAIQTEKRITPEGLANCSSKLLPTGTTIISARGTVGKVCLAGRDMAMNQSCYGLRSKAENGEFFCFYLTKSLVEILEARAHGSVFSTITRDTLDGVATISPSLEAIQSFDRSTGALLGKIKANLEENRILGNQRDALLPKLISGELRIPDAESLVSNIG
jgi:type I restriction enzyme S subunit